VYDRGIVRGKADAAAFQPWFLDGASEEWGHFELLRVDSKLDLAGAYDKRNRVVTEAVFVLVC
jgi:hypothetical protein